MDNWFKNKWFVRAVSLAFAILLYVFVNIEVTTSHTDSRFIPSGLDEVETLNDVPVDIRIDSDRFVVSGVPEFVAVSLEGMTSILTPTVRQRNFEVFVDLEELGEGMHTVDVKHAKIPNELSVYIEPKTIEVTIEERSSKEFPVSVDFINKDQLPEGYELSEPEISPGQATITSSKTVIDEIAIVKVYIDVAGLKESINNREVPVNVYDSQGNGLNVNIDPESVVVSIDVENPSKKVPVQVSTKGDLPDGYTLKSIESEVKDVEIFATNNILTEIDNISTKEIDLSEVTESGEMDVDIAVPDGVTIAEETIKVTIEVEQTKVLNKVPIDVKGKGEQDISFLKPSNSVMNVTVVGNENKIRELSVDDFKLFVDVENLDAGEHEVPVSVNNLDNVEISTEFKEITIGIM